MPRDQFTQQLSTSTRSRCRTRRAQTLALPAGNYTPAGITRHGGYRARALPLRSGTPPIPMVVTSTSANGASRSAYPICEPRASHYGGSCDNDPISNYFFGSSTLASPPRFRRRTRNG